MTDGELDDLRKQIFAGMRKSDDAQLENISLLFMDYRRLRDRVAAFESGVPDADLYKSMSVSLGGKVQIETLGAVHDARIDGKVSFGDEWRIKELVGVKPDDEDDGA